MAAERKVKIFRNGRNQAVRIPREVELPGDQALSREEDGRLVMEPAPPPSLVALLKQLQPIEADFAPIEDPAPEPVAL
jgi:antitoxin VapB